MNRNHQVFIVLGMHSTATSVIARGLADQDVAMGNDTIVGRYHESRRFLSLNQDILRAAGGDWSHPPTHADIMAQAQPFAGRIQQTLKAAQADAGEQAWGWKDPRTALTVELYLPYLTDYDIFFVSTWRNPYQIQQSLKRKHGIDHGADLTREYNRRILQTLTATINNVHWTMDTPEAANV